MHPALIPLLFGRRSAGLDARVQALFANGEQGLWLDPSDMTTMFQDSTGTTRVTAVGQSIGLWLDKSGRGNHASQATAGSRPVLGQDARGRLRVDFNGTAMRLLTPAMTIAQPAVSFQGVSVGATAGRQNNIFRSSGSSAVPYFNNGPFAMFAGANLQRANSPNLNTPYVVGNVWNGASSILIVNSDDLVGDAGTNSIAPNAQIAIGATQANTAFLQGSIYSMIIRAGSLAPDQLATLRAYTNSKSGAY